MATLRRRESGKRISSWTTTCPAGTLFPWKRAGWPRRTVFPWIQNRLGAQRRMQFLCAASSGQEDTTNVQLPPFRSKEAEACAGTISHRVTQLLAVAGPTIQLFGSHLCLSCSHVATAVPGLVMTSHKGSPSRYFPQTSRCNTVFQALPDSMPNSREHFAQAFMSQGKQSAGVCF